VKPIFRAVTLIATFFLAGCGLFGPVEEYKTEPGRTTFRGTEEGPVETAAPPPQKIPGESR
jgi:hypothetical protein